MGNHRCILCSAPTAKLIKQRIPGNREWRIYEFGEPFELEPSIEACLYPAGHIVGSAMLRLEKDGQSLLYSGDFKLTPGISAEPCQPVPADTLIVETTYGLPRYTFPPENEVFAGIVRFCRETLENGDSPVLFGYSLGKSQAILKSLTDEGFEVMLHPSSRKLTRSCQELGWKFPPYFPFDPSNQAGKVIISPPLAKTSDWIKSIRNPKTAMISGWAIDPTATYRYQCDKAFPLSDHADYLDLLNFVATVQPKTVFTVHGFAREFAATLRERGYEAWALGRENQLGLALEEPAPSPNMQTKNLPIPEPPSGPPNSFSQLAATAEALAQTDSVRTKLDLLAELLAPLQPAEVANCIDLLDAPSPTLLNELSPLLVRQSLLLATGSNEAEYKQLYLTHRDNGQVARALLSRDAKAPSKTIAEISIFLRTLASAPNPIFKQSLLSELFRKLSPSEGAYLFGFLSRRLATGLDSELLCQAIANRFAQALAWVQAAFLRCGKLAPVSQAAAQGQLASIRIAPFTPIQPISATTEPSPEAIIEKHGLSVWAEHEHDGMRCQIHKNLEHVDLYATSGERITHLFPEFVDAARMIPQHFICDAVVVPWGYETPLPRSELDKRLNRKAEELFLGEDVEVVLWLVDIMQLAGNDLLDLPLEVRRQKLDTFSVTPKIRITPVLPLVGAEQIENALADAAKKQMAGLVFKEPSSPYNPLSRKPIWLRLPCNPR